MDSQIECGYPWDIEFEFETGSRIESQGKQQRQNEGGRGEQQRGPLQKCVAGPFTLPDQEKHHRSGNRQQGDNRKQRILHLPFLFKPAVFYTTPRNSSTIILCASTE